jgi:hypothetical protein
MTRWLVSAVVAAGVLAGASCGGESVLGIGGSGGNSGAPSGAGATGGVVSTGGSGGVSNGSGGTGGAVSTGGSGGVSNGSGGTGGVVSTGGSGGVSNGTGGTTRGPLGTCNNGMGGCGSIDAAGCDLEEALDRSCARAGCHSALDRYGSLDFSDPLAIASQMVDIPAPHSDITCAKQGEPYRECTPDELAQFCPGSTAGTKLIDTANPEESWVLRKLNGTQGMCGEAMPMAPGNSPENGWNDERRTCLERFFRILAGDPLVTGGTGGIGGTGGTGGTGVSPSYQPLCDLAPSLKQNCSRAGCHSALDRYAGLNLTDPAQVAAQMVDKVASHGDIGCQVTGQPFRACTPDELLALGCPPNALLIDSANPEESWVLKKLRGEQGECGDPMPIAPGNSVSNGWGEERQACYEDLFFEMARFAREQRGE